MAAPAKLFRLAVVSTLTIVLSCTVVFADIGQRQREETYRQLEVFSNVLSILQDNYVEEIDTIEVLNGAIKGLLFSLDPHSSYLPPESYKEFQEETRGSYSGIGIEVTIQDDLLTVVSPIADTPADKAGLKAHDVIIAIDGVKTKNMGPFDAIKTLRGPEGTEVSISIHREDWEEIKTMTFTRAIIPIQSVKAEFLSPGFVYSRITNFQSHTAGDFKTKLQQLQAQQQINGLILDLRNNPGGLLNQAVSVTDMFLSKGKIVYTKGRREDQNTIFNAHNNRGDYSSPLVVLVNEGSASASEIVAGAIQAHKRGIIVGTQTFGKGSVQTIIPLPDGAGLRMTTAKYFTPDDRSIQAQGITPDVEVPFIACVEPIESSSDKDYVTEADLENHLEGAAGDATEMKKLRDKQLAERLQLDNQLRTAYNILKSLNLFSEFKNTRTAIR